MAKKTDLPMIFLPMRYLAHKSKIEPFFRVAFTPNFKNPSFICRDTNVLEEFEHPELLFINNQAPKDLKLVVPCV